jgi:hypothetical protein
VNGFLLGTLLGGLFAYALTRRAPAAPTAQHAPAPDIPPTSSAPSPATSGARAVPVVVMVGFNIGWPENMVATLSYMEQQLPPAVDGTVRQLNTLGRGTFASPRVMVQSTSYGYLATVLVSWAAIGGVDTAWLASTVRQIIVARGGAVASHLRDVTATT